MKLFKNLMYIYYFFYLLCLPLLRDNFINNCHIGDKLYLCARYNVNYFTKYNPHILGS